MGDTSRSGDLEDGSDARERQAVRVIGHGVAGQRPLGQVRSDAGEHGRGEPARRRRDR